MIGALRMALGATLGGAVAAAALRARRIAEQRGVSFTEVLSDLPEVMREDVARVGRAARASAADGRRAAREAELEIDKVLRAGRRKRGDA